MIQSDTQGPGALKLMDMDIDLGSAMIEHDKLRRSSVGRRIGERIASAVFVLYCWPIVFFSKRRR